MLRVEIPEPGMHVMESGEEYDRVVGPLEESTSQAAQVNMASVDSEEDWSETSASGVQYVSPRDIPAHSFAV